MLRPSALLAMLLRDSRADRRLDVTARVIVYVLVAVVEVFLRYWREPHANRPPWAPERAPERPEAYDEDLPNDPD